MPECQPRKLYGERDIIKLGVLYTQHIGAMTSEGLDSKSDIAAELAIRDAQILALTIVLEHAVENGMRESTGKLLAETIQQVEDMKGNPPTLPAAVNPATH